MFPFMGMGGKKKFYPYEISNAIKIVSGDYLYRSYSVDADNNYIFTVSFWVKNAIATEFSVNAYLFSAYGSSTGYGGLCLDSSTHKLRVFRLNSSVTILDNSFDPLQRDPSHWSHIVFQFNSTLATAIDRTKLFINGVEVEHNSLDNMNQNVGMWWMINTSTCRIGNAQWATRSFDGYIAEFHSIDGLTVAPSAFGEAKYNAWVPKQYTGSYGTNGFYLDFSNASDLGEDKSGNNNDWTNSGCEQTEDTPTNNFPTFDPLPNFGQTVSEAGLSLTTGSADQKMIPLTIPCPKTGRWRAQFTVGSGGALAAAMTGLLRTDADDVNQIWNTEWCHMYYANDGDYYHDTTTGVTYGDTWKVIGKVVDVIFDADTGTLHFYLDGVDQGEATSSVDTDFDWAFGVGEGGNSGAVNWEVETGANGFTHTLAGFGATALPICTANWPASETPVVDSEKGLWINDRDGTGAIVDVTGCPFSLTTGKSLVWIKNRDNTGNHILTDTVRGATNTIQSNTTNAEVANPDALTAFLTNGFSLGDAINVNGSGDDLVDWVFNMLPKYGMDIVHVDAGGTGVARQIAHNLGFPPELIIGKRLDAVANWPAGCAYQSATAPWDKTLLLESTAAVQTSTTMWNQTEPTATHFTVGTNTNVNANGGSYIFYLFRSVSGFLKVGYYFGNGSADGPRIYTGFRTRYTLIKNVSAANSWSLYDAVRDTYNIVGQLLFAESTAVEYDGADLDFLSNGFKVRSTAARINTSGQRYIYLAIGDAFPFNNAF